MRVGLISDTQGLLRPEALELFRGVARIIHAGDVGSADVLEALCRIAPVTAVRGNVDHGVELGKLPPTAEVELDGRRFHILHILEELDLDPAVAGFAAVVHGHSHKASVEERGGVLYLNPGSAGPRRFRLPVTLALLDVEPAELRVKLIELPV